MEGHFISTTDDIFDTAQTSQLASLPNPDASAPKEGPASPQHDAKTRKVVCPFCYTEVNAIRGRPCPNKNCYSNARKIPLMDEVFTHELFSVIVVGASSSGKSHFLASLSHCLANEALWGPGSDGGGYWKCAFVHYCNQERSDSESDDNPYIRYRKNVFDDHRTLDSTRKDDGHPPLLLSIEYIQKFKRMFEEPRLFKKSLLLAITDTAGEHAASEAIHALQKNYPVLKKLVKGVIVMLDTPEELKSPGAAQEVLSWFYGRHSMTKLPIALCLSKIDALPESEGFSGELFDSSKSNTDLNSPGRLILSDIKNNSDEISGWMEGNALKQTARKIMDSFKYHAFFAVSSLGTDPFQENVKNMLKGSPTPLRVLDPLLWILWQHGKIGGQNHSSPSRNDS